MGKRIDRLKVKLARVVVPQHIRIVGGKVVHVDGYTYDRKSARHPADLMDVLQKAINEGRLPGPSAAGGLTPQPGNTGWQRDTARDIASQRSGWEQIDTGGRHIASGVSVHGNDSGYRVSGGKAYGPTPEGGASYTDPPDATHPTAARAFRDADSRSERWRLWNHLYGNEVAPERPMDMPDDMLASYVDPEPWDAPRPYGPGGKPRNVKAMGNPKLDAEIERIAKRGFPSFYDAYHKRLLAEKKRRLMAEVSTSATVNLANKLNR